MNKQAILRINIPNPCLQNWDAMKEAANGKYCGHCTTTVYDFSQMTDKELLDFFKQRPATHCGRFHQSQLNRDILPVATSGKLFLSRFNKIAAAIFTVLSFKGLSSSAGNKIQNASIEIDAAYRKIVSATTGEITISGIVKEANGGPLKNAIVVFDSMQVATTDADGKFSFELENMTPVNHNIYFSYGNLITVVRTYHPAMLATSYDVVLYEKENRGIRTIMGGISGSEDLSLPSLVFKPKAFTLTADHKAMLATVAYQLKQNPTATITVTCYPGGHQGRKIYNDRLSNIKAYLVELAGISTIRINLIINEEGNGDYNTIDIKSN